MKGVGNMRKLLVTAVAALGIAAPANAATVHVNIKSTGFVPKAITINDGDSVSWKNVDTKSHQVVANDGSFASPTIGRGSTFTHTFTAAGTFKYHDSLHPSLTGSVKVKGPPPSVAFGLSQPIVTYGTAIMLSGQISSHRSGQTVQLTAQPYGQPSPIVLANVVTGTNGVFGFQTVPKLYTTYLARWGKVSSQPIIAQVAPKLTLVRGGSYMRAQVTGPRSFWHRHVYLQRLSRFGQWVNVASLTLGPRSGRLFQPRAILPRGVSRVRIFITVNQAGLGLLASQSATQVFRRR
jgi:plastocyanin